MLACKVMAPHDPLRALLSAQLALKIQPDTPESLVADILRALLNGLNAPVTSILDQKDPSLDRFLRVLKQVVGAVEDRIRQGTERYVLATALTFLGEHARALVQVEAIVEEWKALGNAK